MKLQRQEIKRRKLCTQMDASLNTVSWDAFTHVFTAGHLNVDEAGPDTGQITLLQALAAF